MKKLTTLFIIILSSFSSLWATQKEHTTQSSKINSRETHNFSDFKRDKSNNILFNIIKEAIYQNKEDIHKNKEITENLILYIIGSFYTQIGSFVQNSTELELKSMLIESCHAIGNLFNQKELTYICKEIPLLLSEEKTRKRPPIIDKYLKFFKGDIGKAIRQLAAQNKDKILKKFLLEFPNHIDSKGSGKKTALCFSIEKDAFKCFLVLLSLGAKTDYINEKDESLSKILSKEPEKYKKYISFLKNQVFLRKETKETLTFPLRCSYLLKGLLFGNPKEIKNVLEIGCGVWDDRDFFPKIFNTCPETIEILHKMPWVHLDIVDKKPICHLLKNTFNKYDEYIEVWQECIKNIGSLKKQLNPDNYKSKKNISLSNMTFFQRDVLDFDFKKEKYQVIISLNTIYYIKDKKRLCSLFDRIMESIAHKGGVFCVDITSLVCLLQCHLEGQTFNTAQEKIIATNNKRNEFMKKYSAKLIFLKELSNISYQKPERTIERVKSPGIAVIQRGVM